MTSLYQRVKHNRKVEFVLTRPPKSNVFRIIGVLLEEDEDRITLWIRSGSRETSVKIKPKIARRIAEALLVLSEKIESDKEKEVNE